ncbi:uncharacterized protein LOC143541194 [Bidens hawaiensis]|uniref:uncharacterized protein LOC143541194 n=1 Tax=Bidens hawaiensis TaxID=980011 RepID=UPI004049B48B
MGNHITSHRSTRVLLPDGMVQEYSEPVTVAELMLDHPQQVVVEFSHPVGRKPKPLGADVTLENNKVYLMVAMKRGKLAAPSISLEEARRILFRTDAVLTAYTGFVPVFARMCPAAVVKSKKKQLKEEKVVAKWPTVEVKPELFVGREDGYYLSRELSVKRSWKPSLDTIKEKGVKEKIRHWLV